MSLKIKSDIENYLYSIDKQGKHFQIAQDSILSEDKTTVVGKWDGYNITHLIDQIAHMELHRGNDVIKANSNRVSKSRIPHPLTFHCVQHVRLHVERNGELESEVTPTEIAASQYTHWIDKSGWSLIELPYKKVIRDGLVSAYMSHVYIACPVSQLPSLFAKLYQMMNEVSGLPASKVLESNLELHGAFIVNFNNNNYKLKLS